MEEQPLWQVLIEFFGYLFFALVVGHVVMWVLNFLIAGVWTINILFL